VISAVLLIVQWSTDMIRPLLATLALCVPPASAETITVCADGCDYTSINAAIGAASDGDLIQLVAETYLEGQTIDTEGKAITLKGATDKGGNATSILDGERTHRVLACGSGETSDTIFENLVITRGHAEQGGGMFIDSSSPTIGNCVFLENSADECCQSGSWGQGGGMFCSFGSPILIGCTFERNSAIKFGAGMFCSSSNVRLDDCTFRMNSVGEESGISGVGGGIDLYGKHESTLNRCVFERNSARGEYGSGGGLRIAGVTSGTTVNDCVFEANSSDYAGGGVVCWGVDCKPVLNRCVLLENSSVLGGGGVVVMQGARAVINDCELRRNTLLLDFNAAGIHINQDSEAVLFSNIMCGNSPGQISGSYDDDGVNCIAEFCIGCALDDCVTDLDADGVTDGRDLGLLFVSWGTCGGCPEDLNGDGVVDGMDFGLLFAAWGTCD
jgi:hypothetical protein